jgi:ketosteroid isomerase-like protein
MDSGFAGSRETDDAAVRAVEAAYDAAWNAGDLETLLRLLTEDVVGRCRGRHR